jgi:hypothetical protein
MFVKNTKPAEKDVELGPRTKAGFRMAHNASVRTVNVTKSTVGMINDVSPLPLSLTGWCLHPGSIQCSRKDIRNSN